MSCQLLIGWRTPSNSPWITDSTRFCNSRSKAVHGRETNNHRNPTAIPMVEEREIKETILLRCFVRLKRPPMNIDSEENTTLPPHQKQQAIFICIWRSIFAASSPSWVTTEKAVPDSLFSSRIDHK